MFTEMVPYLGPYYVDHLGFFLSSKLKKVFYIMIRGVGSLHRLPTSLVYPLSKHKMYRVAFKALRNPNMRWPLGAMGSLDDVLFRKLAISIYHRKTPVKSTTFFIPKQSQWTLRSIEEVLQNPEKPGFVYNSLKGCGDTSWDFRKVIQTNKFCQKPNYIRIRVLQHRKTKQDGNVLFHCHGGKEFLL